MKKTTINQTKPGALVRLIASDTAAVWVRGHYDATSKAYSLTRWSDASSEIFRRGFCPCFTGFTF
jgi:hypothetical protein